ncbi:MAG TPA: glycosyltransferase family 9 protein, partial [Terriglobales bacterium]|nr:glycosyltransferase family 9 protein [Terriglobales bacterium]
GGFRRIAVLRLSSLGDVILALPATRALARAFPGARLDFWTKAEYADVVRFEPAIAHVRRLEPDARRVEDLVSMSAELEDRDLIVDLHGSLRARVLTFRQRAPVLRAPAFRAARLRWVRARWTRPRPLPSALERYARALAPLGLRPEGVPRVAAGEEAERWAEAWLGEGRGSAPWIALCPGARHATKRWPEERWIALHRELRSRGACPVVLSLADERAALPGLAAAADADGTRWCTEPLPRLSALLSRCAAAVTHDSGLMHLAAARGTKVVAIFGSTSPVLGFAPAGEGHVVLCRNEPCQPCTLHGREACPRMHFDCMRKLELREVIEGLARVGVLPARASGAAGSA